MPPDDARPVTDEANLRALHPQPMLRAVSDAARALSTLRETLSPHDKYAAQIEASRLLSSVPVEKLDLRPLRIAVLSSFTVDFFLDVLRCWLTLSGVQPEFYVSPFDTVAQSVMDGEGDLYAFKPDVVWLMTGHRDVKLDVPPGENADNIRAKITEAVSSISHLWKILKERAGCIILQNNADIPAYDVFGNLAGAVPWGRRNLLRLYNAALAEAASDSVVIFDYDHISSLCGKAQWADDRLWFLAKAGFDLNASGLVASHAARLIAAAKGLAKKCIVVDLDNTLWGGVIGDDGIEGIKLGSGPDGEAFQAFQEFIKSLNERGVILAVCSKNEPEIAEEAFKAHPDMRLKLDDIAVFRANWNNKAENIKEIARTLNIGIDSLVFVDDNPAERAMIRQMLPSVEVVELPDDPAEYVPALARQSLFETTGYAEEDGERARFYRENAKRDEFSLTFTDAGHYLASLQMAAEAAPVDSFSLPRAAQLVNKSNQFHLTGTRYTEAELTGMAADAGTDVLCFRLKDRFGDNGLVSTVILRQRESELHIDTWVMSCRVLARTMEEFIANEIFEVARARGCRSVIGLYRASKKNRLVADLYERLGFELRASDVDCSIWCCSEPKLTDRLRTFVERR